MSKANLSVYQLNTTIIPPRKHIGSKARNLILLRQHNLTIPPGFIIPTKFLVQFLKYHQLTEVFTDNFLQLKHANSDEVNNISQRLTDLISNNAMPVELSEAIRLAYHRLFPRDQSVMVRSSAVVEDTSVHAAAGIFESFAQISSDTDLLRAVKKCWSATFSPKALQYYQTNDVTDFGMAIIVQRYLPAVISGVCFTSNPVTNNHSSIVIEAVAGAGSALADGTASPSHFEVNKQSWHVYQQTLAKNTQQLSNQQIVALAKRCQKIAGLMGKPQDIEWAYYQKQWYILQSRPITTRITTQSAWTYRLDTTHEAVPVLKGLAIKPGVVSGRVVVVTAKTERVPAKGIVVAKTITSKQLPLLTAAAAIITDKGSLASSAAIFARELQIPCIVNTHKASQLLTTNQLVTVDARVGNVYLSTVPLAKQKLQGTSQKDSAKVLSTRTHCYLGLASVTSPVVRTHYQPAGVFIPSSTLSAQTFLNSKHRYKKSDTYLLAKATEVLEEWIGHWYPVPVIYQVSLHRSAQIDSSLSRKELFTPELIALKKLKQSYGYKHINMCLPPVQTQAEALYYKKQLSRFGLERKTGSKHYLTIAIPNTVFIMDSLIKTGFDGVVIDFGYLLEQLMNTTSYVYVHHDLELGFQKALEIIIRTCARHQVESILWPGKHSLSPKLVELLLSWGLAGVITEFDRFDTVKELVRELE